MRKMPCLFERDFSDKRNPVLLDSVTPGCEWALAGEGAASRKRDGSACAVIGGVLHARYDAKKGKTPPPGCVPCDPAPDATTGHWPHWQPVKDEPQFRWHREALAAAPTGLVDGTYELCGPKLQGNPEDLPTHVLIRHGVDLVDAPRSFEGLRTFLGTFEGEGLVFAHADGRMCKIRRADYGLRWPPEKAPT